MTEDFIILLSAYLDGELTAEQVQSVEKELTVNAEAQRLLKDMRQVRQMVAATPRRQAPSGFAEQVQSMLEREALLGQEELRTEIIGRNHLRLRRSLAAAAMLVLVGAIVYIVYSVLYTPVGAPPDDNLIAGNPINSREKTDIFNMPEPDVPAQPEPAPAVAVAEQSPQAVELVWSAADLPAERQRINDQLGAHDVDTFISVPRHGGGWQISFVCTPETLGKLVNLWRSAEPTRLALVLPNPFEEQPLRVAGPEGEQVIAAARWSTALTFPEVDEGGRVARAEGVLPNWLREDISVQAPVLPDLRLLGPVSRTDTAVLPESVMIAPADVIAVTLIIEPAGATGPGISD